VEDRSLRVDRPGLLANDAGTEDRELTVIGASRPDHGAVKVNADGSFVYTPDANHCGPDSFTYTYSDESGRTEGATVVIDVSCTNDAPAPATDRLSVTEDNALTIDSLDILANDSDPDGDSLTITRATEANHGTVVLGRDGSVIYTPAADYCGPDSFIYVVSDGKGGQKPAAVRLDVVCVNDPPRAFTDSYRTDEDERLSVVEPGLLRNDDDADEDVLMAARSGTGRPDHGALEINSDGSFVYTPEPNYCGPDGFSYVVSDGRGGRDTGTVRITVGCVNDPPVARADDYQVDEDSVLNVAAPGLLTNDADVEGDLVAAVVGTSQPDHGALQVDPDGSFSYTPMADFCGVDVFTYTISDGRGGRDTVESQIEVACLNDPPSAGDDAYSTDEDETLAVARPGVLVNDNDQDEGALLTASLTGEPAFGSLVFNPDGSFSYTPIADFNGTDSFSYVVSDGLGGTDSAVVFITVNPVADPSVTLTTYWSDMRLDHFTTTRPDWQGCGSSHLPDYDPQIVEGMIFSPDEPQPPGTVPLYHYWSAGGDDAWSDNHVTTAPSNSIADGYDLVRLEGYIYNPALPQPSNTIALYTWYGTDGDFYRDHLTTTNSGLRSLAGLNYDASPRLEGYISTESAEVCPVHDF
jgi:hypothetical protein